MIYSPAELVNYIFENELEADLFAAIITNNEGYKVLPVSGKAVNSQSGCQFEFDDIGLELEPYVFSEEEVQLFGDKIVEHPENVSACLILYDNQVQAAIDYCDGSDDEKRESMWARIFNDLFTQLGMNTHGKVKKFIERGLQNQHTYNAIEQSKMRLMQNASK